MAFNPLSLISNALGGVQTYLIVGAVSLVLGLGAGAYGGYRLEEGRLADLRAADATALSDATTKAAKKQHAVDLTGQDAANAEAYFRGKLDGTIINLKSGAPINVTITQDQQAAASIHAGCVTYGFYRMLVAGERGVTPDSLPLPAGQSVDDCTADEPSDLAARVAADLAAGYGNSEQLNALEAEIKKQTAIIGAP